MHGSVDDYARLSLLALCLALAASCGAETSREVARSGAGRPSGTGDPTAALVPAPPPRALPGAAAPIEMAALPADLEPLASRLTPRALPVPALRAGRSATFTFDAGRRGWVARLPEGQRMKLVTPVYGDGRVFVGGGFQSHTFYGIDAKTGHIDWATAAEDGGPTSAIVEGDAVLFNTESCTIFAVDKETGRLLWKRWLGDPLMGQPAAAGGRVFSGHVRDEGGYGLTAMDLRTGRVLWTRPISADVMNAPILDDDHLYFTTMDGSVWSFEQATGRRRFRRALSATSAPWLHGETLHVARRASERDAASGRTKRVERTLVLAKADGETVRELESVETAYSTARPDSRGVEEGWVYEGSRPTIVDGRSYQTIGDEVQSRDADTGELLWRRRYTEQARTRPATPPAIAGAQLVFGTRDGVLYGLDIDTGMTAWAYEVGEPITAQPVVARGWVYAATTRGSVIGIEVADRTVGGWHMWGGDARHNGPVDDGATEGDAPDEDEPTEGALRLSGDPATGELAGFPLERTSVRASVRGPVARVRVEQRFTNPYDRAVEAVYLFPLPDDAAVDAMELRTGDRVVRGSIQRREEARRRYVAARDAGTLASLLEQERPNLFRQSVANVRPGDAVSVVLEYTQVLPYEEGSYRLVYPMVAGPRYAPAEAPGEREPATEGSSVRQVITAEAARRTDRVFFELDADLGAQVRELSSATHALEVERRVDGSVHASVGTDGVAPDRDLDLRLAVGSEAPSLAVLSSPPTASEAGHLTLVVHPRVDVPEAELSPRELVFVVDTSSSMSGRPMELAKAAMVEALDGLREGDTFRVLRFSDVTSALSDEPLAATPQNVERAKRHVGELRALGATDMTRGLRAALEPETPAERMRIVLLLTDGYVANEPEVFREVDAHLGGARVFAFGVGSAVNRYLLTRLAEVGRGDAQVVTLDESPEEAARAFHARIASPHLTDVEIDWGGLALSDVYPRRAPDLFGDRPLVVHGRYARGGQGEVRLRGRIAGRAFERTLSVALPSASAAQPVPELESLWARARIRDLMLAMSLRPSDALREEVTTLGLRHSLLTQWTSFVAVDESYRTGEAGAPPRVDQAVTLPSGVERPAPPAARHALGGATGTGYGYAVGYGGLGLRGTGRGGGGGVGYGTIGLGSIGAVTRGAGGGAAGLDATPVAQAGAPRLVMARAEVRGSLSSAVVRETLARQRARFRGCYVDALRAAPSLSVRVTLRLSIDPTGAVTAASADAPGAPPSLAACVAAAARAVAFPSWDGAGAVEVVYPLVFAPAQPTDGERPQVPPNDDGREPDDAVVAPPAPGS